MRAVHEEIHKPRASIKIPILGDGRLTDVHLLWQRHWFLIARPVRDSVEGSEAWAEVFNNLT